MFRNTILPVLLSTFWISLSEFFRNQYLLQSNWVNHYQKLGLNFPAEPLNGAVWGLWALVFAGVVFIFNKRFSFWETAALTWMIGFVMMWLVVGNLNVLPFDILPWAIPLSALEAVGAVWICRRFAA